MPYDVAIVGAGPAGSTAAKFLSEKGIKTLLIDKSTFPRDKPCGGGLATNLLKHFPYIDTDEFIDSYSYGGVLHSKSLNALPITSNKPVIATVLRRSFDHALVKDAQASGAEFVDHQKIIHIKIEKEGVHLIGETGFSVTSAAVLGADGVWSTIAQHAGLRTDTPLYGIGLYDEIKLGQNAIDHYFSDERLCHLYLKFEGIPGYGWVFPKKEHVNIGVGVIDAVRFQKQYTVTLKEVYAKYLRTLQTQGILPRDLPRGALKGGALPPRPLKKMYANRVLLCGDAAGLINPLTGEGIDYAMYSGRIAADVLWEAMDHQDTTERFLSRYQHRVHHHFGKDIELFIKGSKQWYTGDEKFFSLVKNDAALAEMVLQVMTGNESISTVKWKLLQRLLYLRLKGLFKEKTKR